MAVAAEIFQRLLTAFTLGGFVGLAGVAIGLLVERGRPVDGPAAHV